MRSCRNVLLRNAFLIFRRFTRRLTKRPFAPKPTAACSVPIRSASRGCSLGNRIPEWIRLVAEGRFIEAATVSWTTSNMPGSRRDYGDALEEDATFYFLTKPVGLVGDPNGGVTHIRRVRTELGEPDGSGRFKPRPILGSEFEVPAGIVVIAYVFDPVLLPAQSGSWRNRGG